MTAFGAESPESHLREHAFVLVAAPLTVIAMVVVAVPLLVKALVPALLVSVQPVCLAHAGDAEPVKLGSTRVITSLTAMVTGAVNAYVTTEALFWMAVVTVRVSLVTTKAVMAVDVGIAAAAKSAVAAIVKALVREVGLALIAAFGVDSPVSAFRAHAAAAALAVPLTVMTTVAVAVPLLVKALVPAVLAPQPVCFAQAGLAEPVMLGMTRVILSASASAKLFVKA
jgi:hypothetical protein